MDNQGMGPKLTLYTFSPDPFPDLNGSLRFEGYFIIHISQHLAIWYIWYGSWWVSTWQLAQCNAMSWLHWNKTGGCGISTLRELLESIPTLVMNYMAIPLQCHKVLEDGNGLFGPICPYKPRCPIYTSHLSALGTYTSKPFLSIYLSKWSFKCWYSTCLSYLFWKFVPYTHHPLCGKSCPLGLH